jgi:hypothetical protein
VIRNKAVTNGSRRKLALPLDRKSVATGKKRGDEMKRISLAIFATLLTMAPTSFATTQAANVTTIAPTMTVSATIQKAVSLTLSTGTSAAASHCTVAAGSDYTMDFGTVDALAINDGKCNKLAPATPGNSNAIYWSDYNLLPVFTSHTSASASTITAQVTTDFGAPHNIFIVRDSANSSTVPTTVGQFVAMGTSTADTIGAAGLTSGASLTRFIGVAVTPVNGAVLTGAQSAVVTFTLTVQ